VHGAYTAENGVHAWCKLLTFITEVRRYRDSHLPDTVPIHRGQLFSATYWGPSLILGLPVAPVVSKVPPPKITMSLYDPHPTLLTNVPSLKRHRPISHTTILTVHAFMELPGVPEGIDSLAHLFHPSTPQRSRLRLPCPLAGARNLKRRQK